MRDLIEKLLSIDVETFEDRHKGVMTKGNFLQTSFIRQLRNANETSENVQTVWQEAQKTSRSIFKEGKAYNKT